MSGISEKLKSAAFTAALQKALDYLEKDPEANALKVMDMVDKFTPDGWYVSQRAAVRTALETKSNWYRLMMSIFRLDPGVRRAFLQNFLVNASLVGSGVQEDTARREGCNVPWAILLDPTSACNLRCTGCWAAEYGNRLNLRSKLCQLVGLTTLIEGGKIAEAFVMCEREADESKLFRFNLYKKGVEEKT